VECSGGVQCLDLTVQMGEVEFIPVLLVPFPLNSLMDHGDNVHLLHKV